MSVAKAQQVDGEPQAETGERRATGSVADRRCQMRCQGDIEKMVIAQCPNLQLRAGTKGKVMEKSPQEETIGNCL